MAEKEQLDILRKEAHEWSNRMTAIEQRLNALKARCEELESLLCRHEHDHLGRAGLFMATEEALKNLAGEVKRG